MIIKYKREIIILAFLGLLCFFYLRPLNSGLEGHYTLKYHECGQKLVELPTSDDELTLYENNKFRSAFWGSGEYRLEKGMFNTKLILINAGGTAETELFVTRKNGEPIIMLDELCDQYYKKEN
ncbi:hypothetical protein [Sphingobacterium multivorum]|uniref:hypothetical protein n=1 Tax=Sphingobacterium multivorum TaxID=28454 RepID=UPI0031B9F879